MDLHKLIYSFLFVKLERNKVGYISCSEKREDLKCDFTFSNFYDYRHKRFNIINGLTTREYFENLKKNKPRVLKQIVNEIRSWPRGVKIVEKTDDNFMMVDQYGIKHQFIAKSDGRVRCVFRPDSGDYSGAHLFTSLEDFHKDSQEILNDVNPKNKPPRSFIGHQSSTNLSKKRLIVCCFILTTNDITCLRLLMMVELNI